MDYVEMRFDGCDTILMDLDTSTDSCTSGTSMAHEIVNNYENKIFLFMSDPGEFDELI